MSISNYTELKTAVENWLDRSDLTDRVPEFIALAEVRINRALRVRGIEERSYTSLVSGQAYYSLPSDFIEQRNVQINTNPVNVLTYRTPQQLDQEYPSNTTGVPVCFTIIGEEIQLKPIPASTDQLEISYYKRMTPLSLTNTTNWVMTNAPDLLLYGSLIEAEAYLVDDNRIPVWMAAYERGMKELNFQDHRGRYSGSHLEIRSATGNP